MQSVVINSFIVQVALFNANTPSIHKQIRVIQLQITLIAEMMGITQDCLAHVWLFQLQLADNGLTLNENVVRDEHASGESREGLVVHMPVRCCLAR